MRFFSFILLLLSMCTALAQKPDTVLATATGKNFTVADLSPDGQKLYENQNTVIAEARKQLLNMMIRERLLEAESVTKGVKAESLVAAEKAKIPSPAETEIKAVYDANRSSLGDQTLDETRKRIVDFLRRDAESKVLDAYYKELAAKHKIINGKDVNAADLRPMEPLFSVDGKSVSAAEFENKYKLTLYDQRADIYDAIRGQLDSAIYSWLVERDAAAEKIDASDYIAREISNKLKDYSDEERAGLENALKKKLFDKYAVKFLIKEPEPVLQNISTDDDPARGPANAPVTVVMFSDFQCPACSATHPVLKKVLAEYAGKIRFVVRDFPLTSLHENAFRAALAANAANAQGKFFEYTEILYTHQDALDQASLSKYAAQLGLNVKQFELDLSLEKTAAEVRKDMADGQSYGITGTPTIFVNGVAVRHLSVEGFREAIDRALKK
jgi:predicted DsbA family dithiol-disulfide isomerase